MKWDHIKISALIFLLTNALLFLCGFHTLTKISLHSTIIAIVLGSIMAFLILSLLFKSAHDKTLDITNLPLVWKVIIIILFLIFLAFAIPKITGFIIQNVVRSISFYLIIPLFLLLAIFTSSKGKNTIVRSSFIYLLVTFLLTGITFLTLFSKIEVGNLLPLIDTPLKNILKSSLLYMLIALSPYFYLSFFSIKLDKERIQSLKKGFLCTHGFILLYTILMISILGIQLVNLYPYPEVAIFKKISFLNIIDRMETIFSLSYFLSIFIYFTITMYGVLELIESMYPIKKRGLILFIIAFIIFSFNNSYTIDTKLWLISLAGSFLTLPLTSKS